MKRNSILLVVVVAALSFAAIRVVRFVRSSDPGAQRADAPIGFRCFTCGHAFQITLRQLVQEWKDIPPAEAVGGGDKAHCPRCKGRFSGREVGRDDVARGDLDPRGLTPPPRPQPRAAIPSPAR